MAPCSTHINKRFGGPSLSAINLLESWFLDRLIFYLKVVTLAFLRNVGHTQTTRRYMTEDDGLYMQYVSST
jgi:hypothetical protein